MARKGKNGGELDRELEDLPPPARWREWMARVEAVVFASAQPVSHENLAEAVGKACTSI
jgi:segregation and condensation protein B